MRETSQMAKGGGSLGRGRKTREETPPIPERSRLSLQDRAAQAALQRLVDEAGGRWGLSGSRSVRVDSIDLMTDLLATWMRRHSHTHPATGRTYYPGTPGLWRAFDELYPLQDPNRWNGLRRAATLELERRGFERLGGSNGTTWYLPNGG